MNDSGEATRVLNSFERGETQASYRLLPLMYEELRQLALSKLNRETVGQTIKVDILAGEIVVAKDGVRFD